MEPVVREFSHLTNYIMVKVVFQRAVIAWFPLLRNTRHVYLIVFLAIIPITNTFM